LAASHELILCHGNGPQVGLLALESAADSALSRPYPLDDLVAETQGLIGYWLVQEMRNAGVRRPVVSLVTQTLVARADPAFARPTKFIGPLYDQPAAAGLAARHGWTIAADGAGWRRVVPSPEPRGIVEAPVARQLLDSGAVVVCGGGGGVPVHADPATGALTGVEAVVDKDLVAAQLALAVGAERMLLLTDVPAVMRGFGTPGATRIERISLEDAAQLHLPAGSMGPKVEACRRFTELTGAPSGIGALTEAADVLDGAAGTWIVKG
jgi:carbamate kinase